MPKSQPSKVFVGMSGGVDSSVSAALLQKAGYDVTGIFLKFWHDPSFASSFTKVSEDKKATEGETTHENKCCSLSAYHDAQRVCQKLGIKLYTINLKNIFKQKIVDEFLAEYRNARTPNPCVSCNKFIKFGEFYKQARALGADYVATGHYIKLSAADDQYYLSVPKDAKKDQSYFLYNLKQNQLNHILFPLGDLNKDEVRNLAKDFGLPVAAKKDSQEICFVADNDYRKFLQKYLDERPGKICDEKNNILGKHSGLSNYTIGQRKGIGLAGGPYYVVAKIKPSNKLIITKNPEKSKYAKHEFLVKKINFINPVNLKFPLKCFVKIRYQSEFLPCQLKTHEHGQYQVTLSKPTFNLNPGQSAVFYGKLNKTVRLLGGGVIV